MKNRFLFCVICILITRVASAQFVWKDTGPLLFPTNISGQIDGIGRTTQIKFSPLHTNRMYACTASGGLWISNNGGVTWSTTGTDTLPAMNTSAICIDYTDDNILYLSSGDPNYYYENFGIWKSTDGGASWALANAGIGTRMALQIIMSPVNHLVLVAATDDGIWKTTDGGATWTETKTGGEFTDMRLKTAPNSSTLFACTIDQLWRSTDMGDTWSQLTNGITMPDDSVYSGCRLAVTAADTNRVYFMTDKDQGTVWKSTDGGDSFTQVYHNPVNSLTGYDSTGGGQGNYNFSLIAHPDSPDVVYTSSHCVWRSADGGVNWTKMTSWYAILHTDMHDFCFDPVNHNKLFNANDGGVWYTTDAGSNWTESSDSLRNTEVYHSGQSKLLADVVSIGTQDNGELMYNNGTWYCNRGGDWSARSDFDYSMPGTVYYFDNGNRRDIIGQGGDQSLGLPFTADNSTQMAFSKLKTNLAFASETELYRSLDLDSATPTWTQLTNINRTILAVATSPADSNRVYFLTNNRRFYSSLNALNASPVFSYTGTPFSSQVSASIAPVKTNTSVIYIAVDHQVYRSANGGTNWTNITANLPGINIVKILYDDRSTDESVFVAAGSKVYYRNVNMTSWQNISQSLPTVANIQDFNIFNDGTPCSKLRVAYYGRGVWETSLYPNRAPVVNITANDTVICPGTTVSFSFGQCGNIDSVTWHFINGSPASSNGFSPHVLYSSPGTYPVTLIGSNAFGSDTSILYITVTPAYVPPVVQGFESPVYPPLNWKLVDPENDGINWQRTNNAGGYGQSQASVLFNDYDYGTNGAHNQIWLQRLNFDSVAQAQLTFDVAYAPWGGDCAYPDSLEVSVSTDCGITQTVLYAKSCDALATAAHIEDSLFKPLPNEWRTDTVDLSAYMNNHDVMVIFDNIGHYGQGIYLDNINIHGLVEKAPVAAFMATPQTTCIGDSVHFTDVSINAPTTHHWAFAGGTPATSLLANPVVVYDSAGTYAVTLIATNGYGSDTQTTAGYIIVNTAPLQPIITQSGNTLLASSPSAGAYQWYFNGNIIAGATNRTYNPTQTGNYTVTLTSQSCAATSTVFNFTFTGINQVEENAISVSPNPNNGRFTLSINSDAASNITIDDATGKQVFSFKAATAQSQWSKELDLRQFGSGVYFVSVFSGGKTYTKKVVVEIR